MGGVLTNTMVADVNSGLRGIVFLASEARKGSPAMESTVARSWPTDSGISSWTHVLRQDDIAVYDRTATLLCSIRS